MSKTRVYTHVSKSWSGEPAEVWAKFFAWMGERPDFEGDIRVLHYSEYSKEGRTPSVLISVKSEPKEE